MPTFHWKGRTADGRAIEGDIDASSKHDALERLREQSLVITEVKARRSSGGEVISLGSTPTSTAPKEGSFAERLRRARQSSKPRPLRGLLISAAFVAAAFAVGAMAPMVVVNCDRTASERVDCLVREQWLGVYTIRRQRLPAVTTAEMESKYFTSTSGARTQANSKFRLVLRDGSGRSIQPEVWDLGKVLGSTAYEMSERAQRFLSDPAATRLFVWQGQWVPLLLSACLLIVAALVCGLSVIAMFAGPTEALYARVGALAEKADQAALAEKADQAALAEKADQARRRE